MALTWITVPGELAGTSTPIQFTLDREPTSISLEYRPDDAGPRKDWLVVYGETDADNENGRFSWRFSDSERAGNSWTVRPPVNEGTWRQDAKAWLVVDELPEVEGPPVGGQAMGAIYEIDFTAQPDQSLEGGEGPATIDGLSWYLKSPVWQYNQFRIVNGQGLVMAPGNVMFWADASWESRILLLPLANVPGYNPLAPLIVRASYIPTSQLDANNYTLLGLMRAILNTSKTTADERANSFWVACANGTSFAIRKGDTTGVDTWNSAPAIHDNNRKLVGATWSDTKEANAIGIPWDGTYPLPSNADGRTQQQTTGMYLPLTAPVSGVPCVGIMNQVTGGGFGARTMTRLQILQPKVA